MYIAPYGEVLWEHDGWVAQRVHTFGVGKVSQGTPLFIGGDTQALAA